MTMDEILTVRNLHKAYENRRESLEVLAGIDLTIHAQEFVCVVGPSGCGKTTLLKLLGGLREPSKGDILFEGKPFHSSTSYIGFVFQEANLMPWRTVEGNIHLPLELKQDGAPGSRVKDLIALVGLQGFEEAYPDDLSGGMAQRVAIARALVHEPDLLLLDEPFGSLDALTRERMGMELQRIWQARMVTVVMVTHSISEAVLLGDRVIVLSDRPARVKAEVPIPLERPRSLELTHTVDFGRLAEQVRSVIQS